MKKLILFIGLLLLVGCEPVCINDEGKKVNQCAISSEIEKQRYRVKVVEVVDPNTYIVEKSGYTVGGIFYLESDMTLEIGEIIYVIQLDDYKVELFSNYVEEKEEK
jgi:hypothetical protein